MVAMKILAIAAVGGTAWLFMRPRFSPILPPNPPGPWTDNSADDDPPLIPLGPGLHLGLEVSSDALSIALAIGRLYLHVRLLLLTSALGSCTLVRGIVVGFSPPEGQLQTQEVHGYPEVPSACRC